ncbi:uncharacterized protein LOC128983160 isoform X1 [Macrosteles quadrilineatus]|uniref:uncharacterized protein LOC128983160 isoform X1 n=1 Tax=Macrosteles quadrilineatus TaxID=74068 RepID=UPI0023E1A708|nr:uncharacterized protein LOC128983160 isoform X1 [Macrosteles quadrilineatus]
MNTQTIVCVFIAYTLTLTDAWRHSNTTQPQPHGTTDEPVIWWGMVKGIMSRDRLPTGVNIYGMDNQRRLTVYNREEWRGRSPRETPVMYTPVTKVVLSRTETEPCYTHEDCSLRVREMQNIHMDEEGEPDIKYQ